MADYLYYQNPYLKSSIQIHLYHAVNKPLEDELTEASFYWRVKTKCIHNNTNYSLRRFESTKLLSIYLSSDIYGSRMDTTGYSTKYQNGALKLEQIKLQKNYFYKIKIISKYYVLTSSLVNVIQKYDF